MRYTELFRRYPAIFWMLGVITVIIIAHLGYTAFANWGETDPAKLLHNGTFLWDPLMSILLWGLAPVVLVAIIFFGVQHLQGITLTQDQIERAAAVAIHGWLAIIIIAMSCNFFGAAAFTLVLWFCKGAGVIILAGAIGSVVLYIFYKILEGLFGNRGALIAVAVIVLLFMLCMPSCHNLSSRYEKFKQDARKNAQERRTSVVEITEEEPVTTGISYKNPNYRKNMVTQGDENQVISNDGDNITLTAGGNTETNGNSEPEVDIRYTNPATDSDETSESDNYNVQNTADDKDE